MCVCVCVCVRACVRVCVCVHACVRVCVHFPANCVHTGHTFRFTVCVDLHAHTRVYGMPLLLDLYQELPCSHISVPSSYDYIIYVLLCPRGKAEFTGIHFLEASFLLPSCFGQCQWILLPLLARK